VDDSVPTEAVGYETDDQSGSTETPGAPAALVLLGLGLLFMVFACPAGRGH
jgi:MYXO-CTERM domain-containing protein